MMTDALLNNKFPVFVAEFAVGIDLAFVQIADHIPVQTGLVYTARFRKRHAQGHVHSPSDLLIKENFFGETFDPIVQTKSDFAQETCSLIHIEHSIQEVKATGSGRLDYLPIAEGQTHVFDFVAIVDSRKAETYSSVYGILDRTREDFSIGEVGITSATDPLTPTDAIGNIGIWCDDVKLIVLAEIISNILLLLPNFLPGGGRV